MSVEKNFDLAFVAQMALQEKQSQQNYRPYIAVHKWFARRVGSLFRSLLLSEFAPPPLREEFFASHNLRDISVGDPFMGGGSPILEANRLGCAVTGFDINPLSHWVVSREIETLDLELYSQLADKLEFSIYEKLKSFYKTSCAQCGEASAMAKYFLWVKTTSCQNCKETFDLFPRYIIADDWRNPHKVILCHNCGEVNDLKDSGQLGCCRECSAHLRLDGSARAGKSVCPKCDYENQYPEPQRSTPPVHRMFAIEYFCSGCSASRTGRLYKKPDDDDIALYAEAASRWSSISPEFVPSTEIPDGLETKRLHRFGYRRYRDLFNARQLLGLELLARIIMENDYESMRYSFATNFSDLLRYQNMLCRYDAKALKPSDVFAYHGFHVSLIQCECNLPGIKTSKGVRIGSGSLLNISQKFLRAKRYCAAPFEIRSAGSRKSRVAGTEWIGTERKHHGRTEETRSVQLYCGDSASASLSPDSLDAIITDPPYFGNIQYSELFDFCSVWLRLLDSGFQKKLEDFQENRLLELSGWPSKSGLIDYAAGISAVFSNWAKALKSDGLFVFTFHHARREAYAALLVAVLNANLSVTACQPCPAEMHGSIHIFGQNSSRIDMVFICRRQKVLAYTPPADSQSVEWFKAILSSAGINLTDADELCMKNGVAFKVAAQNLLPAWDPKRSIAESLSIASNAMNELRG